MRYDDPIKSDALKSMFDEKTVNQESINELQNTNTTTNKETGFVSPILLGSLICSLSFVGMVVSYILYLAVG